jgi:hypothetical protein
MLTLQEFIQNYDRKGTIILLEGKRAVKLEDQYKLFALGKLLASMTKHMLFRSGNADGSDLFFTSGVCEVDPARVEVITPYTGHRQKTNLAGKTISLDTVSLTDEHEVIRLSKTHQKTVGLVNSYLAGAKDRNSIKAAYIIRDTIKAVGTAEIAPASFGIFYDDLTNPQTGGTGHTMHVCAQENIPFLDQRVWFGWLE